MTELAPHPPKVRVTKKQLKQIQEGYKLVEERKEDFSKIEEKEKIWLEKEMEKKLDNIV